MTLLIIFLGVIVGVLLLGVIVYFCLRNYLRNTIGLENLSMLTDALKNGANSDKQEYSKEKSLGGMTNILEPQIRKDFPDFNLELLFSGTEKGLRSILNAKTNKNIDLVNEGFLEYIKGTLRKEIDDLIQNNIDVKYEDITFHRHVIKSYEKKDGTATITVASSVAYFYANSNDKKTYADVKKETRYITKYIYVYDESKFKKKQNNFSINCPNCGAPVKGLGDLVCVYCNSYVKPINLKAWKMISYKES